MINVEICRKFHLFWSVRNIRSLTQNWSSVTSPMTIPLQVKNCQRRSLWRISNLYPMRLVNLKIVISNFNNTLGSLGRSRIGRRDKTFCFMKSSPRISSFLYNFLPGVVEQLIVRGHDFEEKTYITIINTFWHFPDVMTLTTEKMVLDQFRTLQLVKNC